MVGITLNESSRFWNIQVLTSITAEPPQSLQIMRERMHFRNTSALVKDSATPAYPLEEHRADHCHIELVINIIKPVSCHTIVQQIQAMRMNMHHVKHASNIHCIRTKH
jgi:hypothetical protein